MMGSRGSRLPKLGGTTRLFTRLSCVLLCLHCPPPPFSSLHMGSDIWVHPLGPTAPQGVAWIHFSSVADTLHYLRSGDKAPHACSTHNWCGLPDRMARGMAIHVHRAIIRSGSHGRTVATRSPGTWGHFVIFRVCGRAICLVPYEHLWHQVHTQVPQGY